ncbi:MAG: 50S ribosomal protein L17, partial [Verrucomicrobia bacterium 21-51-4]
MRHAKHNHTLGVKKEHRLALMANMASSLFTHDRIRTTVTKAKALRVYAEKIITLAKKASVAETPANKLHFRRLAIARLRNPSVVRELFDEKAVEFKDRLGGYTRIYKLGARKGDAAEMALIELVKGDDEGYTKRSDRHKAAAKKAGAKKAP